MTVGYMTNVLNCWWNFCSF